MEPTLYFMPFSPWSQKARCALRHHRVNVRERVYTPLVGEPALRVRLRRWRGRVTVPVLLTGEGALSDSWTIARYAERVGHGSPLFPEGQLSELSEWNACSEQLLSAGRAAVMVRVLASPEAALGFVPEPVGKLIGRRGAVLALRPILAKYGITAHDRDKYEVELRRLLDLLRAALSDGRRYLLGEFSYGDLAMATALIILGPVPELALTPDMRRMMTDDALAAAYPDLLAWRNGIHAQHPLA